MIRSVTCYCFSEILKEKVQNPLSIGVFLVKGILIGYCMAFREPIQILSYRYISHAHTPRVRENFLRITILGLGGPQLEIWTGKLEIRKLTWTQYFAYPSKRKSEVQLWQLEKIYFLFHQFPFIFFATALSASFSNSIFAYSLGGEKSKKKKGKIRRDFPDTPCRPSIHRSAGNTRWAVPPYLTAPNRVSADVGYPCSS